MLYSIVTTIGPGDSHGNHLAISLAQRSPTVHCRAIHLKMRRQNVWGQAVNLEYVGHRACLLRLLAINPFQVTSGFGLINAFYPRHSLPLALL